MHLSPEKPDVACYASRYPDLFFGFCGGSLSSCDYAKLTDHFVHFGGAEGRVFTCTGLAAPCPSSPPPSPPPPPPPPPDMNLVSSRVQHWWATGRPSNSISDAGVLVRVFDALTPPRGQPKGTLPWDPCQPHTWCEKFNAAWPSSIVSKHKPVLYGGMDGRGGFVLAPTNRIFCASPGDGNSMGHMGPSHGCQRPCDPSGARAFDCSFPPEGLETCLRVQGSTKYNEIVVDAKRLHAELPHSLLGVFFTDPSTEGGARMTRNLFLRKYKEVKDFPLLRLTAKGFQDVT